MTTTTGMRARIEQLEAKIEQLEAEAQEVSNRYLRLAADFDNYKKRARQEQADLVHSANAELIERLLPVVDNFQRVLETAPEGIEDAWLKGVRLTLQQLEELLLAQGVKPIEAIGQLFDPTLHEAIGHEDSNEHPEDTVVTEVRRGYRLHDRVVRPALVRVARPVGD
jgi:molecular chaperone GrpE